MMRKKVKVSHECSAVFSNGPSNKVSNFGSDLRLCVLPNDVLEIIFNLLPPPSLVCIEDLGVSRLTNVTLNVKQANFSVCNTICEEELSAFFTKDRVKQIQKLNLNNIFFIRPAILQRCVRHCKNLTVLSILKCGLSFPNLTYILSQCIKLEELFWTVPYSEKYRVQYKAHSVRKVFLYGELLKKTKQDSLTPLLSVLEMCPDAKDICFDFCHVSLQGYMVNTVIQGRQVIFVTNSNWKQTLDVFGNTSVSQIEIPLFWHRPGEKSNLRKSFLQLIACEETMSRLTPIPNESICSLRVVLTINPQFIVPLVEDIVKMCGRSLQYLYFYDSTTSCYSPEENKQHIISQMANRFISSCCNIIVLDLSYCHFGEELTLHALHSLKCLKKLIIPSCALSSNNLDTEICGLDSFDTFVDSCKGMRQFNLLSCGTCDFAPLDTSLQALSKWKQLSSLILCGVQLRMCQFLSNVAECCTKLESLELIGVGPAGSCCYIPKVSLFIQKAHQLTFIRISHRKFNPNNTYLWRCIESARNLQTICLLTGIETFVETTLIVNAIKKLPFLHRFHLIAPKHSQRLGRQIRQSMVSNGVEIPDVRLAMLASIVDFPSTSDARSYERCECNPLPCMY